MDLQFGKGVYERALELKKQGRDVNQIAKILFDQDSEGINYGIGIVLNGDGKPMDTSSTLLEHTERELELSKSGNYMSSSGIMEEVKVATLKWQRIPQKYWESFYLALPSDAGTGAVKTAVELTLMLDSNLNTLGIEELGWPAYKAIAKSSRIGWEEYPADEVISGENLLPVYQAGPMNTTGLVKEKGISVDRAKSAAAINKWVLLDRAYPGFEYARLLATDSYDDVMRMSYELQLEPFIENGVSFCLAISPTKSFVTFALRPCGLLLIFSPQASREKEITTLLNSTLRARGSSFEHLATRAFAKAMTKDLERLEGEHKAALERLAQAESLWKKHVKGSEIEYLFSENYAGLFRNPKARDDAMINIYNEHIYPVFASGRCRQNITGIPNDEARAKKHVSVFAGQCY